MDLITFEDGYDADNYTEQEQQSHLEELISIGMVSYVDDSADDLDAPYTNGHCSDDGELNLTNFLETEMTVDGEDDDYDENGYDNGYDGLDPDDDEDDDIPGEDGAAAPETAKLDPVTINGMEKRFECDICGLRVSNRRNAYRHKKRIHETNRVYRCLVCRQEFVNAPGLKSHRRQMHTAEEEVEAQQQPPPRLMADADGMLRCPYCQREFRYPKDLEEHVRRHIGQRDFGCSRCDKTFVTKKEMRKHEIWVHGMASNATNRAQPAAATAETVVNGSNSAVSVLKRRLKKKKRRAR